MPQKINVRLVITLISFSNMNQSIWYIWPKHVSCFQPATIMCFPNNIVCVFCGSGLVQCRERIPVKFIIGACVGGGLLLIICISLCITVLVLCRQKTSNWNHQQQALQLQTQPSQQQGTHEKTSNVKEEGYINDQIAPTCDIPFTPSADYGEYVDATPVRGIPMSQLAGYDNHVNVNMAAKDGIPFHYLANNGNYLHTTPVGDSSHGLNG